MKPLPYIGRGTHHRVTLQEISQLTGGRQADIRVAVSRLRLDTLDLPPRLSIWQTAFLLCVSPRTVKTLIEDGTLETVTEAGGEIRIPRASAVLIVEAGAQTRRQAEILLQEYSRENPR